MLTKSAPAMRFSRSVVRVFLFAVAMAVVLGSVRPAFSAAATNLRLRVTNTSFKVGTIGTYKITVTNLGPAATDDFIHVLDTLPAGLSLVSGIGTGWTCSTNGQAVDCVQANALAAGSTSALSLRVSVCTAAFPGIQNTFALSYPGDTTAGNNSVTRSTVVKNGVCVPGTPLATATRGTPPRTTFVPTHTPTPTSTDLQLTKVTSGSFTVGSNGIYVLTVQNLGAAVTSGGITVIDPLPSGLSFVSGTGSGWTCSANGQNVACTTGTPLAAGSSTSIRLTVAIGSAAYPTTTNTASVSYPGDTNTSNNTASKPTTVRR